MSPRHKGDAVRILVGGVPFGNHNIGDEAILEGSVALLRQYCPNSEITVATADGPTTSRMLGVNTCPTVGFSGHVDVNEIKGQFHQHDCFIWCGATGLSDYPETSLRLLDIAQDMGKKTVLWGVGMNSKLNPALYSVQPGRRQKVLQSAQRMFLGLIDAVALEERRNARRVHKKIRKYLNRADLVVVRDDEARNQLLAIGVKNEVIVGGDAAMSLEPVAPEDVPMDDEARNFLASKARKVGVCISAQRKIKDTRGLLSFLNRLVAVHGVRIVFVPMDSRTDGPLMTELRQAMNDPSEALLLRHVEEPRQVIAVASALDAVVSSRLHFLILASNVGVPMVGVARGTKFDNYLRHFGLAPVGSVEDCDFNCLEQETLRLVAVRDEFALRNKPVRTVLLEQLHAAAQRVVDSVVE